MSDTPLESFEKSEPVKPPQKAKAVVVEVRYLAENGGDLLVTDGNSFYTLPAGEIKKSYKPVTVAKDRLEKFDTSKLESLIEAVASTTPQIVEALLLDELYLTVEFTEADVKRAILTLISRGIIPVKKGE